MEKRSENNKGFVNVISFYVVSILLDAYVEPYEPLLKNRFKFAS
jgi:hypothetical protein